MNMALIAVTKKLNGDYPEWIGIRIPIGNSQKMLRLEDYLGALIEEQKLQAHQSKTIME